MRTERIGVVGAIVGVVLGGLVAAGGCVGADDEVGGDDQASGGDETVQSGFGFHRRHRRDAGSVAGTSGTAGATGSGTGGTNGGATTRDGGTGPVVDCEICTTAQRCCAAVEHRECYFSAGTCDSTEGEATPAYVNACLVYVNAVRGVWGGNPPAECL